MNAVSRPTRSAETTRLQRRLTTQAKSGISVAAGTTLVAESRAVEVGFKNLGL